jgi:hypothetical protein
MLISDEPDVEAICREGLYVFLSEVVTVVGEYCLLLQRIVLLQNFCRVNLHLEEFLEPVHELLKRRERADILLAIPVRSLSFQGQLQFHDHGLLSFCRSQSLRPVIQGRRVRVIGVFRVSVRHDVF